MEATEILSLLERLRVAAALGQHEPVSELQAQLADNTRGLSALGQGAVAAGQGRWSAVLDGCGGLAGLDPALRRFGDLLRAEALLELGRAEACLDAARGLQAELPGDHDARVLEGRALFRLRRLDEARPVLEAAVQQAPDSFQPRFGLGMVLLAQGQFQPALDQLRAAQRINPLDEGPYRAMARVFRVTGQVAHGADFLGKLLSTQLVASPGLLLDLAELELLAERKEAVPPKLRVIEEHAALGPLHVLEIARLWCELEAAEPVQRLAARVATMEHPQAAGVATVLQAFEAELQGDMGKARGLYGRACTQLPGHWFPHVRVALHYLHQPTERNVKAAAAHVNQAMKLAPVTPDVRLSAAIVAAAQGNAQAMPALQMVAQHPGMRPSLRGYARATLAWVEKQVVNGEQG